MDCTILKQFRIVSLVSKLILLILGCIQFIYKAFRIFNLDIIVCVKYFCIIN